MIERDLKIIKNEIDKAIQDLQLKLGGLTILTEAASNIYFLAPVIALAAGAKKVYALSSTTKYSQFSDIAKGTYKIAEKLNLLDSRLEIINKKHFEKYDEIDIVTNLGHVRPLDRTVLPKFRKGTIISYMCEAWEYRRADLDLKLCQKYNLKVYGINEEHPLVNCFVETGLIGLKMIFDSKISLLNAKIAIVSRDKFGREILKSIRKFNQKVILIDDLTKNFEKNLKDLDLLLVADVNYPKTIIGDQGIIRPQKLKALSPNVKVLQYCGSNSLADIKKRHIPIYPDIELEPQRMFLTLGDISYRSIVRLYTAGLKVGEIAFHKDFDKFKFRSLIQPIK